MMASVFTSCPTFWLSLKKRTHSTRDASRSGLCMTPVRHDATVWPRAGSHIGHFRPIRILCCASLAATGDETESGDGIGLASQRANTTNITAKKEKKKKIQHNTTSILICEVDNVPLFMIHLILLDKKRFGFPAVFALHSSSTLFTLRLCFVTTLGDSYCLQVTGSTER